MGGIAVDLAFTPRGLDGAGPRPVVVLIDVLRATSTIATLFHLGARTVRVTARLRQAQRMGRGRGGLRRAAQRGPGATL